MTSIEHDCLRRDQERETICGILSLLTGNMHSHSTHVIAHSSSVNKKRLLFNVDVDPGIESNLLVVLLVFAARLLAAKRCRLAIIFFNVSMEFDVFHGREYDGRSSVA